MDKRKIGRIAAAALIASGMTYASPALAVDTTAEDFVVGLSSDFSRGDLTTVLAKLEELKRLGLEGILFDNQMVSIDQLIALLTSVQQGDLSGAGVAAILLAHVDDADLVRFVNGGIFATTADLNVGVPGSVFPAGSAG